MLYILRATSICSIRSIFHMSNRVLVNLVNFFSTLNFEELKMIARVVNYASLGLTAALSTESTACFISNRYLLNLTSLFSKKLQGWKKQSELTSTQIPNTRTLNSSKSVHHV